MRDGRVRSDVPVSERLSAADERERLNALAAEEDD
jgi:hypothetical protein